MIRCSAVLMWPSPCGLAGNAEKYTPHCRLLSQRFCWTENVCGGCVASLNALRNDGNHGLLRAGSHWRQSRIRHGRLCRNMPCRSGPVHTAVDVRHSGDKNHPLSTKSTELNMFNFGDNVDRDKLTTNRQQSRNLSTLDFVAGVYRASDATMQRSSGSEYGNLFNAMKTFYW